MGLAMDVSEQSNFAFSPLKLRYDTSDGTFSIRANPFGTNFGRQYIPPTWGNGNGFDVTLLAGEQFAGAAPTYNGVSNNFNLLFAFFASFTTGTHLEISCPPHGRCQIDGDKLSATRISIRSMDTPLTVIASRPQGNRI
jgi:hypothetical protein